MFLSDLSIKQPVLATMLAVTLVSSDSIPTGN